MMLDEKFLNDIGMADVDQAQKEELADQLAELVENEMALKLVDVLSQDQMEKFDQLLEEDKDEEAYDYLLESYPAYQEDLQTITDGVKQSFVDDMSGLVQDARDRNAAAVVAAATAPTPAPAEVEDTVGPIPPVPATQENTPHPPTQQ